MTFSTPMYCVLLVTSPCEPPVLFQVSPLTSGSASTGLRSPQMTRYQALATLLLHPGDCGHRTGNVVGGGFDDQSVLSMPPVDCFRETVPLLVLPDGLDWPSVVHSSVKSFVSAPDLTVTFSIVASGW